MPQLTLVDRPRPVVVDTSVALKWFLKEEGAEEAKALLSQRLFAPELLLLELANVLGGKCARGVLSASALAQAMVTTQESFEQLFSMDRLFVQRAAEIQVALKHPIYDCAFLTLTEGMRAAAATGADLWRQGFQDSVLITADDKLIRVVRGTPWEPMVRQLRG